MKIIGSVDDNEGRVRCKVPTFLLNDLAGRRRAIDTLPRILWYLDEAIYM